MENDELCSECWTYAECEFRKIAKEGKIGKWLKMLKGLILALRCFCI